MILSERVRRERGERILNVTPLHVVEQMQHEMWSRCALPQPSKVDAWDRSEAAHEYPFAKAR